MERTWTRLHVEPGWVAAAAFLVSYVAMDWASYLWPMVAGYNITPWNPQQAFAVALLAWWPSAGWLVFIAVLLSDVIVRGWQLTNPAVWLVAGALTLTSLVLARQLIDGRDPTATFETRRALRRFAFIVVVGSLVAAVSYVWILSWGRGVRLDELLGRTANYWIGNMVGLLVTLPLLLTAASGRTRVALQEVLRSSVWWVSVAASCAALWIAFGQGEEDSFKFFYLLLLPVVWCSARFGAAGAILSANLTQVGLIMASRLTERPELTVYELQGLMAAAAGTAFLIGVVVDERARAEAELRRGLRFSAAGQLAAGLAHELGQPLTAMSNFAQASRRLVERAPEERAQLTATLDRMLDEASRATEVARRLRDFFTTGALSLQTTEVRPMLDAAVRAQEDAAARAGVRLEMNAPQDLPPVWVDRVQLAIVLRNLLANAIESAPGGGPAACVAVDAWHKGQAVQVEVTDTGPGIAPNQLGRLFEAEGSDKATGMGVGLSICRSIVEAHGGRLWAEPGPGGRLVFSLPVEAPGGAP